MIYNIGSINIDHVYQLERMPKPGETLTASHYQQFLGGKGINQSVAIAKAGGQLVHIGAVGPNGDWALEQITALGVGIEGIAQVPQATGAGLIYLDQHAENMIVIFGGANQALTQDQIDLALADAGADDWVLLQNETNLTEYIVDAARKQGCKLAYSPAPFIHDKALALFDKADLIAVNEHELAQLAQAREQEADTLGLNPGEPALLITYGSRGAEFRSQQGQSWQAAFQVTPVDTTGAGDTFLGSFLAAFASGQPSAAALRYAAAAAALQVTRPGAAPAIPTREEVEKFMQSQES